MIKGLPSVDFKPHNDLMLDLLDDPGIHVNHIVIAGEEKFLEFNYVNMGNPGTVYFDINDTIIFKGKVAQSLKEQKGKGFNPKNTILNPGEHSIDHILTGFTQYKQKGRWHILLDKDLTALPRFILARKILTLSTIK